VLRQLLRGEKEIASGEAHDFESLLAEADRRLSGDEF
jgi:hypothetical protein